MALVLSATHNRAFFINHTEVKTIINSNGSMDLLYVAHGEEHAEHLSKVGSTVKVLGVSITLNPYFNEVIAKLAFDAPQHIVINTGKVYYRVTKSTGGKLISRRVYTHIYKNARLNREAVDNIVSRAKVIKTEDDGTEILKAGVLEFSMRANVIHRVDIKAD